MTDTFKYTADINLASLVPETEKPSFTKPIMLNPYKEFTHRIEMCHKFNEGTELQDGVCSLLSAAGVLYGINDVHHAELALMNAEDIIRNYILYIQTESSVEEYQKFPDDLYQYFTGTPKPEIEQ